MKRAFIIHCWGGRPNYAWYPWVKAELEKKGYQVMVPQMPDTGAPRLDTWLPLLKQVVGAPDEDLVLIGHSIGAVTIMRYLESLHANERVGKIIFVAGFTNPLGYTELENFFESPLSLEKIKSKSARGLVAIQSDNDPYVAAKYGEQLRDELGAKLVIKHAAGHMSGDVDDEGSCNELPEVLAAVD